MTDRTPAAQAAQQDWNAAVSAANLAPTTGSVILNAVTVLEIAALLSKLRAPVADERAEWQAFRDWAWKKEGPAVGQMEGQAAVWAGWQERARRAALASAPVAGHQPYPAMPEPDVIAYGEAEDSYSRSAMKSAMRSAHDRGYSVGWDHGKENASAPVAGEAVAWLKGDGTDVWTDAKKKQAMQHTGKPGAKLAASYSVPLTHAAPRPGPVAGEAQADLAPPKCPITGRPFFMALEHPELGMVPTYGGPYDSYTIPHLGGKPDQPWHERDLRVYRYDHDLGGWIADETEVIPLRIVHEDVLHGLEDAAPQASEAVRTALHDLVDVLQKRHFGRMPEEVQRAFDAAHAALSAQPGAQKSGGSDGSR